MGTFINDFIESSEIRRQRNTDAEFMNGVKKMHLETQMRLREKPSPRREKFAGAVWEWCKEQSDKLKAKYNN